MDVISVNLKTTPYKVYIKNGITGEIPYYLEKFKPGNFSVVVTNEKILSLHTKKIKEILKGLPHKVIKVTDGEKAKSVKWAFRIIKELLSLDNVRRRIFILCIGGGVIGDLGGFVAAIYKRGIPYLQIPTTLVAQVDASIGGKTAINLKEAKNIVGAFYQPKAVFIDPEFLFTLSTKHIKQGFAEIIKYSVIKDKTLFFNLRDNHTKIKEFDRPSIIKIIKKCVKIKTDIVVEDEKETKGIRTILNFGHTIGHALEASLGYKKGIAHGEAVSLGMLCASYISLYLNMCPEEDVKEIENMMYLYSLPTKTTLDNKKVIRSLSLDKKFIAGNIRMVLISGIGKVKVRERIPLELVKKSLDKIRLG